MNTVSAKDDHASTVLLTSRFCIGYSFHWLSSYSVWVVSLVTLGAGLNPLHDLIFISQVKIFSSGRALQTTLRAAP